jgi:hypothetical protein
VYKESVQYLYKGKAIPLHAWTGPEVSKSLRLPEQDLNIQQKLTNLERSVCEHFRRGCYPLKGGSRISDCVNETCNKFRKA